MRPCEEPSARLWSARGFTLVEALIVVGLVAVIAALAIPEYRDYIVRSKRSAARQVLMEAAQYLERNYTTAGCYDKADQPSCLKPPDEGTLTVRPSALLRAPSEGRAAYLVTWALASGSYTLTAIPCAQAGGACPSGAESTFNDTDCGALTLTQTGLRGAIDPATQTSLPEEKIATCWQR